jgi:glycine hydroxymethyltransferase
MHVIAAKAVAFKEALEPGVQGLPGAGREERPAMAKVLIARGYKIVSGGTENHLMLVDLIGKEHHRQGSRGRAGQGPHHRQQELGAERPAQALRHLRHAHRHAGDHHARLAKSHRAGSVNS